MAYCPHRAIYGKYLKNYELEYENKSGKSKKYEIVSRSEITSVDELGKKVSGVSIVVFYEGKMLLLKEFRMAVNRYIYNLCAGMIEPGETLMDTIERELHEETGLFEEETNLLEEVLKDGEYVKEIDVVVVNYTSIIDI